MQRLVLDSPIGPLTCLVREDVLVGVEFAPRAGSVRPGATVEYVRRRFPGEEMRAARESGGVRAAFERYFSGNPDALDTLTVDPGGTPFQSKVWLALREIASGKTWSYAQLAERVGSPAAVRAVGAANGANPIPLVLPCHRVIGKNGKLVGYGGGMDRKEWLLRHEGRRDK
ncbi:MAG: methylated-DNA--[protein]-cysteine S-methyltransferase [Acidobacteriota bacterium]|nr:methylated-DNA--[protein]-cysteine S-methyltransferase [Acidobacteriota bacterium]